MKLKVQTAYGATVELRQYENIKWHDKIYSSAGLTLDECRREMEDDIKIAMDCDDAEYASVYEEALDDLRYATSKELLSGCVIRVEGREKAWRIIEDKED